MRECFWNTPVEPKKGEAIFRVRHTFSNGNGGANFYYHADIIAKTRAAAMLAAKEGRVTNWRWIDTFDSSEKSYEYFTCLGKMTSNAEKPNYPVKCRSFRLPGHIKVRVDIAFRWGATPQSYEAMRRFPRSWMVSSFKVFHRDKKVASYRFYPAYLRIGRAREAAEAVRYQLARIAEGQRGYRNYDRAFKRFWRINHSI